MFNSLYKIGILAPGYINSHYFLVELLNKESYLFPVCKDEEPVHKIFDEIAGAFDANMVGPAKYLVMYERYFYILNGEAERELHEFFGTVPFPYLKDFSRKIYKYEEIKNEIIDLRRSIPLNMIMLDCSHLNETLYKIIDGLRTKIVNFFIDENHQLNRRFAVN